MDTKTLHEQITEKYAWPGGYPMFLVMADSETICMDCAAKNEELILRATNDRYEKEWVVAAVAANWEDTGLYCGHCGEKIESAYGEDE
jgi:hypothetical protein